MSRGRRGGRKEPVVASTTQPVVGKTAKVAFDPQHFQDYRPIWRIGQREEDGPWSWVRIKPEHFHELVAKIREFERFTWRQLDTRYDLKELHHYLSPRKLCKEAAERLERLQIDPEAVFSFHLTGRRRMIGVRDGPAFNLLWWDPDHTVSPSRRPE